MQRTKVVNAMCKHRVTAKLAIPKLPDNEILGVEFLKIPNFKQDPIPQMTISNGKECEALYTHIHDVEIRSPYFMRVEVETNNESQVEGLARERFDRVVDNLSFLLGDFWGEYKIVKIETLVRNEWKSVYSPFSYSTRLPISINPVALDSGEMEMLKRLVGLADLDEIYRKSLFYLGRGMKRLNRDLVRGEDRVEVEVFLDLFKPIELISNSVCRRDEGRYLNHADILGAISRLFGSLFRSLREREKVAEDLIKEYNAGKLQYLPDKIRAAGGGLRLAESNIESAVQFSQLRSRYDIAHAHKTFGNERVDYAELCNLSRVFIKEYLNLLLSGRGSRARPRGA